MEVESITNYINKIYYEIFSIETLYKLIINIISIIFIAITLYVAIEIYQITERYLTLIFSILIGALVYFIMHSILKINIITNYNNYAEINSTFNFRKTNGVNEAMNSGIYGSKMLKTNILIYAKKNIKLLGITINRYFNTEGGDDWEILKNFVQCGGNLQILMLDPESKLVDFREKDESNIKLKEQILHSLEHIRRFCNGLDKNISNVEIRLYDSYPQNAMTIIDDKLFKVTPYLFKKRGAECPTYEYLKNDDGSYKEYESHFNALWESAKPFEIC